MNLVTWYQVAFLFLGWLVYRWGYRRGMKDAALKDFLPQWRLDRAVKNAAEMIARADKAAAEVLKDKS